jgi:enamine deaminase RidA (YjgF/YER057c/UK114 family)
MKRAGLIALAFFTTLVSLTSATSAQTELPTKKFATPDGKRPTGLFAPGVMVGKTLYVAGKGDYRQNAEFPEKVRNCLGEIRKTLKAAGLDMHHVVKSFVYLEDPEKYAELNTYYGEFFPNSPPARTTLGVAQVPGESRVEITCIAYSDLAGRTTVGAARAGFPYSPGVLAGDTLYVSGKGDQISGGGHPATFEEQVRRGVKNVEATLKEAGLDFRHVVMSHVFLDRYENIDVANRVYNEFFEDGNEPACATVLVNWIPGGSHVEVTCIATTDLPSRKVVRPAGAQNRSIEGCITASPAVWAGNTLYLSGLPGVNLTDGVVPTNLADQVHQMARNHTAILDAAGLTLDDIVSGHVYLQDMKDYQDMNAIYKQYFSRGPGVRTCLMPSQGLDKTTRRVQASFIAAKTRQ